ncbi:MurR/RpiR family transcriptional regulator [Aestuariirhabdus sp. LZHN29]|uniref:MurR/RpiR family transcriptional regulator n=1 Tax=Aestuariirhabdus sp. LZHN29 TaxID=3417462 RepID=UPI003CEB643E
MPASPPLDRTPLANTLPELQQIPARLQRGELNLRLGKRAQQVLNQLLDNPRVSATHNISELGQDFGVSPSTLTRLAQSLGFEGFNALQQLFRAPLKGQGHFYSEQLQQAILARPIPPLSPHTELIQQVVGDEVGNIDAMRRNLNPRTVRETVQRLAKAPRIYLFGHRQSYSLASFFSYTLGMLRQDVELLDTPGHGLSHGLSKLREGDLLVLIGSAPYSAQTIRVAEHASRQGAELVAITDSHSSPLAAYARYPFVSPTSGAFFSNSQAAYMVLIEGLLSQTARYLGERAVKALRHREQLINDLQDQY